MAQLHLLRQLGMQVYRALQNTICVMFVCKINVDRSERKKNMENHRQKQDYEAMEPSKKKKFLEKKQVRDMTNNHELKMKQLKYKAMDTTKKQDILKRYAKKQHSTKQWTLLKQQYLLNKKAEQIKIMDTAKKQDLLSKKQNNTKQWTLLKTRSVKH